MKLERPACGGASALDLSRSLVHHLDVKIGGAELYVAAFSLDQNIGEDRDRIAPFHHGLGLGHGLEQCAAFDAEFHTLAPVRCRSNAREGQGSNSTPHLKCFLGVFGWNSGSVKGCRLLALKSAAQKLQVFGDLPVQKAEVLDAAHAVHDGGVIASAKAAADLGQ